MKKAIHLPIPVMRALRKVGQDINVARRRRRISIKLMSERAGISRSTISKIEKGDSTTSMGAYAVVLFILGMLDSLRDLADASHDVMGLMLEEERLPKRIYFPREKKRRGRDD